MQVCCHQASTPYPAFRATVWVTRMTQRLPKIIRMFIVNIMFSFFIQKHIVNILFIAYAFECISASIFSGKFYTHIWFLLKSLKSDICVAGHDISNSPYFFCRFNHPFTSLKNHLWVFQTFFSHAEWPIWMITWGRRVLEDTHPDAPNRQTLAAGVEFIFHLTGLASLPQ